MIWSSSHQYDSEQFAFRVHEPEVRSECSSLRHVSFALRIILDLQLQLGPVFLLSKAVVK